MHCYASAEAAGRGSPAWLNCAAGVALALALLAGPVSGSGTDAAGFRIREAVTRLVDGVYLLDARIDFAFSDAAREAMDNGVSLTIVVDMEVVRDRLLFDKEVARIKARFRVETHAISGQYIVTNLNSGETRTYRRFEDMVDALGRIRAFPVVDHALLDARGEHLLKLRAYLDVEALPSPLRPLAYLSALWKLDSEWHDHALTP